MRSQNQIKFSDFKEKQMEYEQMCNLSEQIETFQEKTGFWMVESSGTDITDEENTDETKLAFYLAKVEETMDSMIYQRRKENEKLYKQFKKEKLFTC